MTRIKNHEDFMKKLINLYGNEYQPIDPYINSSTKVKMKHNVCGFEYEVLSGNILKGRKCPKCSKRVKTKDTNYFKQEVYELVQDEYIIKGEYVNSRTKVLFKHNTCGYEYLNTPNDFQQGTRCPKCARNIQKTNEEFLQEIKSLVDDEYTILSEYTNTNTHVKIKHNTCGHIYDVTPSNFLRGRRCSKCKISKGEKSIADFLCANNINYKSQFFFKDLKSDSNVYLRFDFAVFENGKIKFLIEYDGEFHYQVKESFGGLEALLKQQKHDAMKDQYCKNNNYKLIRIPYWEYKNIEEILRVAI